MSMTRRGWLIVSVCLLTLVPARGGAQNSSNDNENPEALLKEARVYADRGDLEEDALRRIVLSGAVGRLEERDRELIGLRYGADLTARQIAELHGAKTNAIEVALHRALGRLRAQMEGDDESSPAVRKSQAGR